MTHVRLAEFVAVAVVSLTLLSMLALAILGRAEPPSGEWTRYECGPLPAPETTTCDLGEHAHRNGYGATLIPGYTYAGMLEMRLAWSGDTFVWRCPYDAGYPTDYCTLTGIRPPVLAPFTARCASYDVNTATPGGSGDWGCSLEHG